MKEIIRIILGFELQFGTSKILNGILRDLRVK
jgi:hypothetical protein